MVSCELAGKTVAVTGGARGIGLAIARACSDAGMSVAIGDLSADASAAAARSLPGPACGLVVDVRDRASFVTFLDGAEAQLGPLHAVVNNAGVLRTGPFADASPADVSLQVEVNLGGVLTGTQLALERFLPRGGGHVVNLASTAAMVAAPQGATYSATKHAVLGFTRALRGELRGSGVLTTVVVPGVVRTGMTGGFRRAWGVRTVEPELVGSAVVAALRRGTPEIYVPREVALQGRLFTVLPARIADQLSRLTGAARVMH
jgi:NAD(P)-dependent dehydrogenase (short-subunit alcohol dehydrogenase family)